MDITSRKEKSFEISNIKKTIVIQIDDNENKSETTIIDPKVNLILTTIMDYYKKKEVHTSGMSIKQNKLYNTINKEMNKVLTMKKNAAVSEEQGEELIKKNEIDVDNLELEKTIDRKHRFLNQDMNKNYN
ncbi:MAG: hypothetical protein FWC47_09395 [Oscillospiraceae bacterium]|nr:hypothetical protein [Oscillospiraceae bacterium]